jgi:L-fucose mutarotase/ribose pyranase (RbsD/FucU family)
MLKGLDPILGPDLFATLRAVGHADESALIGGDDCEMTLRALIIVGPDES